MVWLTKLKEFTGKYLSQAKKMEIKQVNVKQGLYLFADTERCIHHGQVSIPVITLLNFFFFSTWSAHTSLVHYSVVSQQRSSSMLSDAETPLSCWDYLNWFLCNLALFLRSPVHTGSSQMVGRPGFGWPPVASGCLIKSSCTVQSMLVMLVQIQQLVWGLVIAKAIARIIFWLI